MNDIASFSYWILLFPFLSFLINGLYLCRKDRNASAGVSIALNGFGAAYAVALAWQYFTSGIAPGRRIAWEYTFLPFTKDLVASVGMLLDPLSVMMLVVVTLISFFVNIYSVGYMREDLSSGRFFALLSFFSFSMLGLVVAPNAFQMYFFWELVGISSYLLIGFWYHKPSAVAASKQAFILTRFADSFFLLGIVLVSYVVGSFDFSVLNSLNFADAAFQGTLNLGFCTMAKPEALTLGAVLIFTGGWGKSAMFPMHIWLPNAMEGPTPVSSIIHSATMVVAGVYLVARLFPFFAESGDTLTLIMVVGAFTAIFAAVIACTQKDIKRILAYSTLSQLGYMMFALGACTISGTHAINAIGYSASTFHIFNHAFFKCMLFLVAGSLIHQVHTNDLDAMGGLGKKMRWTYWCTLFACLAISGIPPFSGFFSKDEIIKTAFENGHFVVFGVALLTSGITAFYMFRLFFLAFHGTPRSEGVAHAKEDPAMTFPIIALAVPTIFGGYLARPVFEKYFRPGALQVPLVSSGAYHSAWIPVMACGVALIGIFLAWFFYCRPFANVARALDAENRPAWYKVIYHKFYFDEIYYAVTRQFIFAGVAQWMKSFDDYVIGGLIKFVTFACRKGGELVRELQTGYLPLYIGTLLVGLLVWRFVGHLPV